MSTIQEVINNVKIYNYEEKKLSILRGKFEFIANDLNMDEVKKSLNYAEAKKLYQQIRYSINNEKRMELEGILKDKKIKEYPQLLDVHYYPIIKQIEFLKDEEKIKLDTIIDNAYESFKERIKLSELDAKTLDLLLQNSIIEKQYVFHCTCGGFECTDKIISEEYFNKLKVYWKKQIEEIETTEEEDKELNYGCFETGCWNDGTVEVCSLDDFNKNLRRIDYKVIKEPDMTLDNI